MSAHRVADLVTIVARSAAVGLGLIAVALIHVARGTRKTRSPGTMQERMLDTKARQRALAVTNKE